MAEGTRILMDFVVMATHGRTGRRHLFGHSVTEAVERSGLAPVIVQWPAAHRGSRPSGEQRGPAAGESHAPGGTSQAPPA